MRTKTSSGRITLISLFIRGNKLLCIDNNLRRKYIFKVTTRKKVKYPKTLKIRKRIIHIKKLGRYHPL